MARSWSGLAAALVLCVVALEAAAQDRPRVIAVNYPLQYFAERLLGDAAEVVFPAPDDVDPSLWRPSIEDVGVIQSADLILLSGAGFAAWAERVSLPRSRLANMAAAIEDQFIETATITHSHGDGGEHSHAAVASYLWLDPTLAMAQAEAAAAAIAARGLAPEDAVERRLDALRADLAALDAEAREKLRAASDVAMIATHPRYHYLARRYDLAIAALEWDAGAPPNAQQLVDLEALIAETGARVLLWEAPPPAAALDATRALGLENVVFPPLARRSPNDAFLDAFGRSIAALSEAASRVADD